jgi:hypothetical protein
MEDKKSIKEERNLVVNYTMTTGEFQNSHVTIIKVEKGQSKASAIHEYFKEFWNETHCDVRSYRYNMASWEQALKIDGYKEATDEEVAILNKFNIF